MKLLIAVLSVVALLNFGVYQLSFANFVKKEAFAENEIVQLEAQEMESLHSVKEAEAGFFEGGFAALVLAAVIVWVAVELIDDDDSDEEKKQKDGDDDDDDDSGDDDDDDSGDDDDDDGETA